MDRGQVHNSRLLEVEVSSMTPTKPSVDIHVRLDGQCVRCRRKTITYSAPGSSRGVCSTCLTDQTKLSQKDRKAT